MEETDRNLTIRSCGTASLSLAAYNSIVSFHAHMQIDCDLVCD